MLPNFTQLKLLQIIKLLESMIPGEVSTCRLVRRNLRHTLRCSKHHELMRQNKAKKFTYSLLWKIDYWCLIVCKMHCQLDIENWISVAQNSMIVSCMPIAQFFDWIRMNSKIHRFISSCRQGFIWMKCDTTFMSMWPSQFQLEN